MAKVMKKEGGSSGAALQQRGSERASERAEADDAPSPGPSPGHSPPTHRRHSAELEPVAANSPGMGRAWLLLLMINLHAMQR